MVPGLDSSFDRPTPAQAAAAYAAGVRAWGGYFGSADGLGLATRWSRQDFEVVKAAGMTAIGFCSGWDDPNWIRDTAAAWGILAAVDVEAHIRDDGPWVQPWLDVSLAGLYGNSSVHYNTAGRRAAFHIVSWYFAVPPACFDPALTWPWWLPRPAAPCGWQFCGTHSEFGLSVDRSWVDDWFAPALSGGTVGADMNADETKAFARVLIAVFKGRTPFDQAELDSIVGGLTPGNFEALVTTLEMAAEYSAAAGVAAVTLKDRIDKLPAGPPGPPGPPGPAASPHTHPLTGSTGSS